MIIATDQRLVASGRAKKSDVVRRAADVLSPDYDVSLLLSTIALVANELHGAGMNLDLRLVKTNIGQRRY
jgi:hypothetical protein